MPCNDEGSSWRDDLVAEATLSFLGQTISAAALAEIEMPHLVVCTDPETGVRCYSGPYADGLTALAAAEFDARRDQEAGTDEPMEYSVAALLPPTRVPLEGDRSR